MFSIDLFYKKLSLYIQIPNIYFGLGFEFEFSHRVSVVRGHKFLQDFIAGYWPLHLFVYS